MAIELGSFSLGGLVGIFVGSLTTHFLSRSRDKENRDIKDFNEAAAPLAAILEKERNGPMPGTNIDFSVFRRVLKGKELEHFDSCVAEYHQVCRNTKIVNYENMGDVVVVSSGWYRDVNAIVSAIDNLLECTKRK